MAQPIRSPGPSALRRHRFRRDCSADQHGELPLQCLERLLPAPPGLSPPTGRVPCPDRPRGESPAGWIPRGEAAGRATARSVRTETNPGGGRLCALIGILSCSCSRGSGLPFFCLRILQGAGTSLLDSGFGAVIADLSPPAARAQMFAIYTIWINVAGALMPALRRGGYPPCRVLPAVRPRRRGLGASFLLILRLPETARPGAAEPVPFGRSWPAPGRLLGGILVGWVFGTLSTFVPVTRIAAGPGRVGPLLFRYSAGLIAVRLAGSYGISYIIQPKVLLPGYGVFAAGLALLPLGSWVCAWCWLVSPAEPRHGVIMPVIYALLLVDLPATAAAGASRSWRRYDLVWCCPAWVSGSSRKRSGFGASSGLGGGCGLDRGGRARCGAGDEHPCASQ